MKRLGGARVNGAWLPGRELSICRLMAEGLSDKQIARALFLSQGSVKVYLSRTYARFNFTEGSNPRVCMARLIWEHDHTLATPHQPSFPMPNLPVLMAP